MTKVFSCFKSSSDGNTSFLRAARAGNLDKVLEHLKNNVDINTSNANGLNALHLAAKDGHVIVVAELLQRGAIVDNATKKGNTALHIASLAGQEDVVKLLLQHSASVNAQSQNGFTPLYMAAQENHDSVVKLLLSNGANQSLATEDGFTPLAVAMQQGHDKVVAVLLESDTRGKVRLPALHIAAKKDDVKAATLLLENDHNPDVTSKSGFTPLHIASHYGNESIANLLIQKGADVNFAAKHNISPLHVTAKWGKTNMVSLLLEKGANIESKTRDGLTPLHCAARSGHEQVVDMLLERGAPISAKTKNGLAPLHMAAQGEHVDAARILLYHRAPVDEVTVDYLTALHVAAHCGHVRVAKLLLDRNADANARALNGFTPLHIACKKNRIKVVELLLKHGASISATTESGLTPLHVASFMGCMNIVIYLLQHEASPDVPTVRGETPLHLAARANQTDIIRILLRNGAQVDARAREQQTPLHIASRLGNVDIVMLLLQHGAQVDATTKDMYTALHIAAKEGQDEVVGVLIENGASLDATTKKGFTPLHLAAKYGHMKVGELLLLKDAPVDAQGKNGVTPLHVASHYDHQNVALLLLNKGASPHSTAKNGHTPLHIAARKNQMDIATTLLEYGAQSNAESKAGFTPLHLSAQEGHTEMSSLLLEHKADANHQARNGLAPMHLCAQEDKVQVAQILVKHGAEIEPVTKAGYTPLHVASHFGQSNMVRFLVQQNGANVNASNGIGYTPLHQAAQQGHCHIVNLLVENNADPNALTQSGQSPLNIANKLGYISVVESLKNVTNQTTSPMQTSVNEGEKYRVVAPEAMHETFMSDSEEEGGDDNATDQPYRYLTVDEMKSLGDDSLPIDVTRDERIDSNRMVQSTDSANYPSVVIEDSISPQHITHVDKKLNDSNYIIDNVKLDRHPQHVGFLVSFLVDARGGAMRGCRHSGIRIIVPARSAAQPTRVTCRYIKPQRTLHPPQLMEGEALASRVLELGPVAAKFLGPVVMEVPHFASLRGKEREIVILRSDNGETWREHSIDNSDEIVQEILNDCFEPEDLNQMDDLAGGRICRFVTYDFPQYFAVVSRIRQEVHAIGPDGGMVSSTVVPQVQAVFPQGALTKKIKVGLQAQPIDPDLTAKLLGRGVAVSPIVTVEPRRRKFHKAITLSMPAPKAHSQGMINQYSGNAPTLRLLCSITGGPSRAQWEDVTGSTPLTFVNDCVSFTTTVSARFWLMDCRNISEATKMATELYREAIHVPFMANFVVFAKRVDPMEARLRVFCMTDDKEDKTLEHQENFTQVAKSKDVEVLEGKPQYTELAGNFIPITKSGEQLQFQFKAFRENRLPFSVRVKDQHADTVGRALFMREPRVAKGEQPQQPICILNIVLPDKILPDHISVMNDRRDVITRIDLSEYNQRALDSQNYLGDLRIVDISNLLGKDWVRLAPEIDITEDEISTIKEQYPNSTARQAQSMLRIYQTRKENEKSRLEDGLRTIGRDDIITKCMKITSYIETSRHYDPVAATRRSTGFENGFEERDLMKDSESLEELVFNEGNRLQQLHEREELKYSAEEKIVEDSESEEDENVKKSVAERREQIQKRLSIERQIPASSQKKEIVQEITEIKRQSLIEDKKALHEEEIIMRAPTDNIIKPTSIPEPIIKLKSTRKDETVDLSKSEFDKELQNKIKTSIKGLDDFEHKIDDVQRVMFETDKKIEYDSTVTEKSLKSLAEEPVKKAEILSNILDDTRKQPICDNKFQENLSKKSDTITTIRFLQHEKEESAKMMKKSSPKDTTDDLIHPELAAKLNVQMDKIVDFVEVEREILSPVKCEIKKTISSDQIDAELSSKLSKQKEKAERIVEDESQAVIDQVQSTIGDDEYLKDLHTEKTVADASAESSISQILTDSQQILSDNKLVQAQTSKLKENVSSTVRFLEQEIEDANNFVERRSEVIPKTEIEYVADIKMERKSSRGPFVSDTDSDEFYKTIEEKITKKLSQDMSAMKDDIATALQEISISQTPPPTPNDYQHQRSEEDANDEEAIQVDDVSVRQASSQQDPDSTKGYDNDSVRIEAINLVDSVLDQSCSIVYSQHYPDTIRSESEHFAITCDVTGIDLIKSPTIESMSGKSFDDFMPDIDVGCNVNERNNSLCMVTDHITDGVRDDVKRYERIERKFERLSSQLDVEFDKSGDQCQADFDRAVQSNVQSDEVSNLQSDFSKISWDESASATTGDMGLNTPDNDIQELPREPGLHTAPIDIIPKPSPRLTKPIPSDASATNDELITYSRQVTEHITDTIEEQSSENDKPTDYSDTKKFWQSLDSNKPIDETVQSGMVPVPKPRSQITTTIVKNEESIESNSVRELSHSSSKISSEQQVEYSESSSLQSDCKQELRDDDSMAVEERLEDESYPISDKVDSDFYDIKNRENLSSSYQCSKEDSFEIDLVKDKDLIVDLSATKKDDFSIYKTKEREDILDLDDHEVAKLPPKRDLYKIDDFAEETDANEEKKTSFYIGESSVDVITKSSDLRNDYEKEEFEFDDDVQKKIKTSAKEIELTKDEFESKTDLERSVKEVARQSQLEQEIFEFGSDYEKKSSAVDRATESEKEEIVKCAEFTKASRATELTNEMANEEFEFEESTKVIEAPSSIQSELNKINESFADVRKVQFDKDEIEKSIVEQTFAEVQESLEAVHEDLIEVVKGGRQIKESPSEFEIKILPNIKYPQLEAHEEEFHHLPETSLIKVGAEAPQSDVSDVSASHKLETDASSNEDSINKLDVVHRSPKPKQTTNRWSVSDPDNYSSSGSHYESFEKTDSRPCSSDVENLLTYGNSSEYQTALDASQLPGSTEYQSAASWLDNSGKTISSRESMKSFDSESSGHLGSVENSENSETLVPSTMDIDLPSDSNYEMDMDDSEIKFASLEACSGVLLEEYNEEPDHVISPSMKRSQEMTFQPYQTDDDVIEKSGRLEKKSSLDADDSKLGSMTSLDDGKFATSLEDGSVLSMSLSSASNVETIVENVKDEMASSFGSSLIGSYEVQSLIRDEVSAPNFDDSQESGHFDNKIMTTSIVRDDDIISSQATSTTTPQTEFAEVVEQPSKRIKGHKRADSTSFLKGLETSRSPPDTSLDDEMIVHEDVQKVHIFDEDKRESGSDSDNDPYQTEYARSFKQPEKQGKKKSKIEKVDVEKMERKISIPSIETIVEDVIAEVECEGKMERAVSQNMLDYSNIPDIMVTDDPTKDTVDEDDDLNQISSTEPTTSQPEEHPAASSRDIPSPIRYAKESEIKITEEEYQELIDKQYKAKLADVTTRFDYDEDKAESPTSDSFEMLEQPDITDEFVIIEEVAKEAGEFDTEGKSVKIKPIKYVKKHDDEVETILVKSAPAATNEGSVLYQLQGQQHDLGFDFEESPPTGVDSGEHVYEPNEMSSSRKWVEMQLAEQAQNLRYPYEMERGMLEDIKEEDTDLEVGSSRISSFKDSFSSSTPEYDILAGRKYFAKGEHDDMSVNSLQEFESLEQAISLENRKFHQGSSDSLSNGSFPKRYTSKAHGDDVSIASLKEFEGLENACLEAHLVEIKAKEEAALLLSRSDESSKSDKSKGSPRQTTITTKTTVVSQSQSIPTRVIEERVITTTTGFPVNQKSLESFLKSRFEEKDDDSSSNLMEVSSDSLDIGNKVKLSHSKDSTHYGSSDSLEQNKSGTDIMTSSLDSIEISKEAGATAKSSRSDVDSIDQYLLSGRNEASRRDSIDSIEMQLALMAQAGNYERDSIDGNTRIDVETSVATSGNQTIQTRTITTTTVSSTHGPGMSKDISNDSLNVNQSEPELLLTSTESLDQSSSVATNATYTNEMNSQMSGSITSCGSNTLIDSLDGPFDFQSGMMASSSQFGFDDRQLMGGTASSSTSTTTTTVVHVSQTKDGEKTYEYFEVKDDKGKAPKGDEQL
ncbi:hypothetical protein HA402_013085 [Bradysia odoriphaga]|nr:hypothetical protein HA402_013085 [Bradysia odoriphaga]